MGGALCSVHGREIGAIAEEFFAADSFDGANLMSNYIGLAVKRASGTGERAHDGSAPRVDASRVVKNGNNDLGASHGSARAP